MAQLFGVHVEVASVASLLDQNLLHCAPPTYPTLIPHLSDVHVEVASLLNENAGQRKQLVAGLVFKLGLHDLKPVPPVPLRQGKEVAHPRPHVSLHARQIVR